MYCAGLRRRNKSEAEADEAAFEGRCFLIYPLHLQNKLNFLYTKPHMAEETRQESQTGYPDPAGAFTEMVDAGVFYGKHRSKTHPRMRSFVLATRGGIEIINLEKTEKAMEHALEFLKSKIASGGEGLLVGTQPEAEQEIKAFAERAHIPSVTKRWLGGTLTNFKVILDRLNYWKKIRENLVSGAYQAYTKKERLEIEREIKRLEELFGGIEHMTKRPDFLIVIDPKVHRTAIREAKRLKIPVITMANIDSKPDEVEYLVVGNTKSRSSNGWFLGKIEAAYEDGLKMRAAAVAANEQAAVENAPGSQTSPMGVK